MAKVSALIKSLLEDENYKGCSFLVFNEDNKLIACERFENFLFKSYQMLKDYELVSWVTDYSSYKGTLLDKGPINTCVIFGKFITDNERVNAQPLKA